MTWMIAVSKTRMARIQAEEAAGSRLRWPPAQSVSRRLSFPSESADHKPSHAVEYRARHQNERRKPGMANFFSQRSCW